MNRHARRFFAGGCLVLGGAFVSLSVSGWAQAATPVDDTATAVVKPAVEEDQPGWDCTTMGNKDCGPGALMMADAWQAFDGANVAQDIGKTDAVDAFKATYVATYSTKPSWPGYMVVPSKQYPNVFHVFKIDAYN